MTKYVGTYSLEDLLAQRFVPASQFGFDNIARAIQAHLDWLNAQVADQVGMIAETTDDVRRVYGASEEGEMVEVDELGVARTQKDAQGAEIDFPLRKFSRSTGFTADFMARATPADLATKVLGFETAYITRFRNELKAALFGKANYSFVDKLGDGTTLAVKRLLNADGMAIPNAPDGTTFAKATHQITTIETINQLTQAILSACMGKERHLIVETLDLCCGHAGDFAGCEFTHEITLPTRGALFPLRQVSRQASVYSGKYHNAGGLVCFETICDSRQFYQPLRVTHQGYPLPCGT